MNCFHSAATAFGPKAWHVCDQSNLAAASRSGLLGHLPIGLPLPLKMIKNALKVLARSECASTGFLAHLITLSPQLDAIPLMKLWVAKAVAMKCSIGRAFVRLLMAIRCNKSGAM